MGELANDRINGEMCDSCGCYFKATKEECKQGKVVHAHGVPTTCWDCWGDLSKEEKKDHVRAIVPTL